MNKNNIEVQNEELIPQKIIQMMSEMETMRQKIAERDRKIDEQKQEQMQLQLQNQLAI